MAHMGECNGEDLLSLTSQTLPQRLTGGTDGGVYVTDVTNASRTLLMNIRTLRWDPELFRCACHLYELFVRYTWTDFSKFQWIKSICRRL